MKRLAWIMMLTLGLAVRAGGAADTPVGRASTRVYLWQFDSSKTSPIESITDATPAVLSQYPPLPAGVVFHHWAPSANWLLLGGCFRYRVVLTGSVPPTPSTFGLASTALCSAPSPNGPSRRTVGGTFGHPRASATT